MKKTLTLGALVSLLLCNCTCPDNWREVPRPRVRTAAQVAELTDCQIKHYGTTLLSEATTPGVVRALLARGAQPNGIIIRNDEAYRGTALMGIQDSSITRQLIAAGADANMAGGGDTPPLCNAAMKGDTSALSTLLAAGADPNKPDKDGNTPLLLAAARLHTEACNLLLARGARADMGNISDGNTPLMAALKASGSDARKCAVAQALLAAGADPVLPDAEGNTPLHLAPTELTSVLLSRGASAHARNYQGRTPIFFCRTIAQADLLMRAGADINASDHQGYKPFDIISNAQVKSYLLTRGASGSSHY